MIAFLGTGLLGFNFVRAMINRGLEVQVWNRTHTKAKDLEQYGAKAFENVAAAVTGADIIHLTLKDDHSVNETLAAASAGFKNGCIIVDHTTTSKAGAIRRTREWKDHGFIYQHAPVFMGPPNALESTGHMMVSGNQEIIAQLEPHLSAMTGNLLNFGDEVGRAAAVKLIGNAFLVAFTAGIADTLSLANAMDVPLADLNTLFTTWNPGTLLLARLKRMTSDDFKKPAWKLNMARKDVKLFIEAAGESGNDLAVIPAIATLMDRWIEKGHGNDDWTVIGKNAT